MLNKAHKIQLLPTETQKTLMKKSCGVARHSYNWALENWQKLYELGEKPGAYSMIKLQNSIKQEEYNFYLEVTKCAPQYAIHNLEKAYKKMWKEGAKYPKFKKKGVRESYVAVDNNNNFKQENNKIWIPRIGWVKCHENLRYQGKVVNVTIKCIVDKWFAVVNIITNNSSNISENQTIIGVDLGVKELATLSDGITFSNPKAYKSSLKQLNRLQRAVGRKQIGSNNRLKAKNKLAKKYYRISCIRSNALHQATSFISKNYSTVVIEDLNVDRMLKNHHLAQSIADAAFGEFRRQLTYKCQWYGAELIVADRYFPSSKICSCCGNKKETLKLSDRTYKCENCGLKIDRDLNASKNLADLGTTLKSRGSYECGDRSSVEKSIQPADEALIIKI